MLMHADTAKHGFGTRRGMGPLPVAPSQFPHHAAAASQTVLQIHTTCKDIPQH